MRAPHAGKRRLLALLALLALFAIGCEADAPQDFLKDLSGNRAKDADRLWDFTFIIAVVIFFIVEGVLVLTLLKFRQRPGRQAAQFHGNTKLEVVLTIIPSLILAGVAVPTVQTIFEYEGARPDNALQVEVIAHQFWWEYRYPDLGVVTANELHIPVGQPVYLTITSALDDVNHSFWIPKLSGTQDSVPGRLNTLNFTAEEPGVFLGQCKEFCGLSHANMRLRVFAEESSDFQSWVAEQQEPAGTDRSGLAAQGEETFMQSACIGCHAVQGTDAAGIIGPDLTHFADRTTFAGAMFRNTEENLIKWVSDAPSVKPGAQMPSGVKELGLSPEDVEAIVAYLLTLK